VLREIRFSGTKSNKKISCHDNLTLFDKIASSNGTDNFEDRVKQNLLAAAMVYTAQGVPFIQAGEERLRTKVKASVTILENLDDNVAAFTVAGGANGEIFNEILVIYNPNKTATTVTLPAGEWKVCVNDSQAGTGVLDKKKMCLTKSL